MRKITLVSLIIIVSVGAAASYFYISSKHVERGLESTVSRVIDGDTVELANGDRIRLLGMDAPEKDQPYYTESRDNLKGAIEGKVVRMERDVTNADKYGRFLRYIYLDDHFVNLEMVQSGLAYAYIQNPDNKYKDQILEAEAAARKSGIGIWGRSEYADCISLESLHYNARGNDTDNLSDEFFSLKNSCGREVYAQNWTVKNTFSTVNIPSFVMRPNVTVKIITGSGVGTELKVFLSRTKPFWNNNADVLYLRDEKNQIILDSSYKNQ